MHPLFPDPGQCSFGVAISGAHSLFNNGAEVLLPHRQEAKSVCTAKPFRDNGNLIVTSCYLWNNKKQPHFCRETQVQLDQYATKTTEGACLGRQLRQGQPATVVPKRIFKCLFTILCESMCTTHTREPVKTRRGCR